MSGSIKRFRKTTWRFQRTFQTPLRDLGRFVATILSGNPLMETAFVVIDEVVFDPKHLGALLAKHDLPPIQLRRDSLLTANNLEEIPELLEAALGDWVDFAFVPTPKPFVIYADHDEYTTFCANTKSNLNPVVSALSKARFKEIEDYERRL